MKPKKVVLSFDLDNTLINNREGIVDSFNYALFDLFVGDAGVEICRQPKIVPEDIQILSNPQSILLPLQGCPIWYLVFRGCHSGTI